MQRQDLPLDVRRRFLSGSNALDLTHTGGEGESAVWEIMHSPPDVVRWLGVILEVDGLRARPADLSTLHALRAAITRMARGRAAGHDPEAADITVVNSIAARPPLVPQLNADGSSSYVDPTVAAALSSLARETIDLFSGPYANRIRICAAADCGLLFVDSSRPGQRRWCSMQRCGNLAKVRTHRGWSTA